eukprot:582895-Rhodomonas_salina.2
MSGAYIAYPCSALRPTTSPRCHILLLPRPPHLVWSASFLASFSACAVTSNPRARKPPLGICVLQRCFLRRLHGPALQLVPGIVGCAVHALSMVRCMQRPASPCNVRSSPCNVRSSPCGVRSSPCTVWPGNSVCAAIQAGCEAETRGHRFS